MINGLIKGSIFDLAVSHLNAAFDQVTGRAFKIQAVTAH
jgi:hypothetical protein